MPANSLLSPGLSLSLSLFFLHTHTHTHTHLSYHFVQERGLSVERVRVEFVHSVELAEAVSRYTHTHTHTHNHIHTCICTHPRKRLISLIHICTPPLPHTDRRTRQPKQRTRTRVWGVGREAVTTFVSSVRRPCAVAVWALVLPMERGRRSVSGMGLGYADAACHSAGLSLSLSHTLTQARTRVHTHTHTNIHSLSFPKLLIRHSLLSSPSSSPLSHFFHSSVI